MLITLNKMLITLNKMLITYDKKHVKLLLYDIQKEHLKKLANFIEKFKYSCIKNSNTSSFYKKPTILLENSKMQQNRNKRAKIKKI